MGNDVVAAVLTDAEIISTQSENTTEITGEISEEQFEIYEEPQSTNRLLDEEYLVEHSDRADLNLLQLWYKEAGAYPLLTRTDEVYLAQLIETSRVACQQLESGEYLEGGKIALLQIKEKGERAKRRLIMSNLRLVLSIVFKYFSNRFTGDLPPIDMLQDGHLGLMTAIDKYNFRIARFSTYATWWIRQTIARGISDAGRSIKVPSHISDKARQFYNAERYLKRISVQNPSDEEICRQLIFNKLEKKLDRPPTEPELKRQLDKDLKETLRTKRIVKQYMAPTLSLDFCGPSYDNEDGATLGEKLPDQTAISPEAAADTSIMIDTVRQMFEDSGLSPEESTVLDYRFGLSTGGKTFTLEEIGQMMKKRYKAMSTENVRQISLRALRKLRSPKNIKMLRPFLAQMKA